MASDWTSQEPQVANEHHLSLRWGGFGPGERFRCYLCGHRFMLGDYWRFVFGIDSRNFMTCRECDGPDVHQRFKALNEELRMRFWWSRRDES